MWSFFFFFSHAHENSHTKAVTSAAPAFVGFLRWLFGGVGGEVYPAPLPSLFLLTKKAKKRRVLVKK